MKYISIFILQILFLHLSSNINAQDVIDLRKHIVVTGSAEKQVVPDEIQLEIIIHQYYDSKTRKNVKLKTVEDKFKKVLEKNNINIKTLTLSDSHNSLYWWDWWYYYRYYPNQSRYNLKLDQKTNFLDLVKDLNKSWVRSIRIVKSSNKNIAKYRKEVKKAAVKAAKEKATYLLDVLDESLGEVLSIREIKKTKPKRDPYPYHYGYGYWGQPLYGYRNNAQNLNNSNSNVVMPSNNNGINNNNASHNSGKVENVATIKLRYEFEIKFAIK